MLPRSPRSSGAIPAHTGPFLQSKRESIYPNAANQGQEMPSPVLAEARLPDSSFYVEVCFPLLQKKVEEDQ